MRVPAQSQIEHRRKRYKRGTGGSSSFKRAATALGPAAGQSVPCQQGGLVFGDLGIDAGADRPTVSEG